MNGIGEYEANAPMYDTCISIILESRLILGQMAPYLLLGFAVAGALSVWVSPEWVERRLGGHGLWPVLKASLFGVPLPLCSCGVIPVAASLRRHGASRAATTAFLLSTPQTGVDSIAVTYALLGPVFAVFRPIAAFLTGLFGGALVRAFGEKNGATSTQEQKQPCCHSCCEGKHESGKLSRAWRHGFVALPKDIALPLLVGILIAGALATFVPANSLATYVGGGALSILIMMAAGVPVYVCATASVPIALGFMHLGASPGAALAFLIAGPATNAVTVATTWKVLGRRTALIYLFTVAAGAFACGLLLDQFMLVAHDALPQLAAHQHATPHWYHDAAAGALLLVLAFSFLSGKLQDAPTAKGQP